MAASPEASATTGDAASMHDRPASSASGDRPISVVFIDHSSENGGAELALLRLLQAPRNWRPALIVPPAARAEEDAFAMVPDGVTVHRAGPSHVARKKAGNGASGSLRVAMTILASAVGLLRIPTLRRSDVLVANTTRASVYVAIAAVVLRKPFVLHVRDMVEPSSIGGTAVTLMRRLVLPRAAGVIANSRASLATVEPYLRSGTIVEVLPSPAGLAVLDRREALLRDETVRVGMVARIDPWKGQELLIRAFTEAARGRDVLLTLYGSASFGNDEYLERLIALADELGISEQVEFAGHVDDVGSAILETDVCVQYSTRPEPLGQNVLQYLAAGSAVIAADEGGPTEWITHEVNGLLVEPRSVPSLTAALRRLLDDVAFRTALSRRAAQTPGLLSDAEVGDAVVALLRKAVD